MAVKKAPVRRLLKKVTKERNIKNTPKTVQGIKKQYQDLPLDFLFGIEEEIDHQCPILDEYLDQIEKVKIALLKIRTCQSLEKANVQAATALFHLQHLSSGIDEVTRGNFEKLRQAHLEWKQLAIRAIDDTQKPDKYLKI